MNAPSTNIAATGQVNTDAARVYEEFFVPSLFGEWAAPLCDAAAITKGQRVLDVACGTGIAAREALTRVGPGGAVSGLDRNAGMLAVARQICPQVDWHDGLAEALPFEPGSFDAVLCLFGLMFFEDRHKALEEMHRVLRPGGRVAVGTWDRVETSPGYAAMIALLQRLFGHETAEALTAPFVLGDADAVAGMLESAGFAEVAIQTQVGRARFASLDAWLHTDVRGWTLGDMIDEAQYAELREAARHQLKQFVGVDGSVSFDAPAHIVTGVKE